MLPYFLFAFLCIHQIFLSFHFPPLILLYIVLLCFYQFSEMITCLTDITFISPLTVQEPYNTVTPSFTFLLSRCNSHVFSFFLFQALKTLFFHAVTNYLGLAITGQSCLHFHAFTWDDFSSFWKFTLDFSFSVSLVVVANSLCFIANTFVLLYFQSLEQSSFVSSFLLKYN